MSAILSHAKAFEALATACEVEVLSPGLLPAIVPTLNVKARVYRRAAVILRDQAKAEALEGATGDRPAS